MALEPRDSANVLPEGASEGCTASGTLPPRPHRQDRGGCPWEGGVRGPGVCGTVPTGRRAGREKRGVTVALRPCRRGLSLLDTAPGLLWALPGAPAGGRQPGRLVHVPSSLLCRRPKRILGIL